MKSMHPFIIQINATSKTTEQLQYLNVGGVV